MSQKGSYLLQSWNIDDANRVLRLIQDRISALNANPTTAATKAAQTVAASGGSSGSFGVVKTIFVVFTDPGGGIIIDRVGRASLTPTVVLGP